MKAYADLAEELGQLSSPNEGRYVSKMKGHKRVSPRGGMGKHYGLDHTGRSHIASRRLPKMVSEGSYQQINTLLDQGASPEMADNKGRTPLHFAAVRGQVDIVQALISHGAVVNKQDNIGNTPLHLACVSGHIGVVTALLRAGTNVTATDTRGSTPLHLALSRLRILDSKSSSNTSSGSQITPITSHRKREVEKIIDMIREYLCMGRGSIGSHGDSSEKQQEIDDLDSLASRLTLSDSEQQVDEVSSLLLNFTELSIHKQS